MWKQKCENYGHIISPTYALLANRVFWTLTAKRFHGYYLSDFTLNIFGYDPFGNKTQISTNFCELICRPAAATILLTTIFHIAHLNRDTRNFSGLHQSWPGVTCLTYNSSKSEKGWFLSHQEDHFCDCFWMAKRQTFALSRQYIFQKLYMWGFIWDILHHFSASSEASEFC